MGLVAEVLQFHEKVPRSENLDQAEQHGAGVGVATSVHQAAYLALTAAGEADEALAVLGEEVAGEGGRTVALGYGQVGGGDEAAEVGVPLACLGQQHQVVGAGGRGRIG